MSLTRKTPFNQVAAGKESCPFYTTNHSRGALQTHGLRKRYEKKTSLPSDSCTSSARKGLSSKLRQGVALSLPTRRKTFAVKRSWVGSPLRKRFLMRLALKKPRGFQKETRAAFERAGMPFESPPNESFSVEVHAFYYEDLTNDHMVVTPYPRRYRAELRHYHEPLRASNIYQEHHCRRGNADINDKKVRR